MQGYKIRGPLILFSFLFVYQAQYLIYKFGREEIGGLVFRARTQFHHVKPHYVMISQHLFHEVEHITIGQSVRLRSAGRWHIGRVEHIEVYREIDIAAQLRGRRWGIVGLGNIGHEVARLAAAFGCEVAYSSTSGVSRSEKYPCLPLDELLAASDVVSVHCPLNDHTRGLIGEAEFSRMKPTAILINVARGGIVDEAALARALDAGTIRSAALDVFSSEPLRESPLYALKDPYRLLASPHNAWSPVEAIDRLIACVVANIEDFVLRRRG